MPNIKLGRGFSTYNVIEFNKLGDSSYIQVSNPISGRDLNLIKKERKDLTFPTWAMQFEGSVNVFEYSFILNGISVKDFKDDDIFILIAEINVNFNDLKEVHIHKIPVVRPLSAVTTSKEKVVLPSPKKKKIEKVKETPEVYDDGSIQGTLFDEENIEPSNPTVNFESMGGEDDELTTASNTPKGGYNGKTKRNVTKKKENTIPRTPRDYSNHLLGKSYIPNPNDNISWRNRTGNYGVGLRAHYVKTTGKNFDVYYDVYIYIPYFQEIFKTDISFKSTDELEKKFPLAYKKNSKTMVLSIFIPEELRDIQIKEDIKNGKISEGSGAFAQITLSSLKACMTKAYNKLLELD